MVQNNSERSDTKKNINVSVNALSDAAEYIYAINIFVISDLRRILSHNKWNWNLIL